MNFINILLIVQPDSYTVANSLFVYCFIINLIIILNIKSIRVLLYLNKCYFI